MDIDLNSIFTPAKKLCNDWLLLSISIFDVRFHA